MPRSHARLPLALLLAASLLLGLAPGPSSAQRDGTIEHPCPESFPIGGVQAQRELAGSSDSRGYYYDMGAEHLLVCEYEIPGDSDGGLRFELWWNERPIHAEHMACQMPGYHPAEKPEREAFRDGWPRLSSSHQAGVAWKKFNTDADHEDLNRVTGPMLETLEAFAIPCSAGTVALAGAPTCMPTVTVEVERADGTSGKDEWTLEGADHGLVDREDTAIERFLQCTYRPAEEGYLDRSARVEMTWWPSLQPVPARDELYGLLCEDRALFPDQRIYVNNAWGWPHNAQNADEIRESFGNLVPDQVAPCVIQAPPSELMASIGGGGPMPVELIGLVVVEGRANDWLRLNEAVVTLRLEGPDGVQVLEADTGRNGQYATTASVEHPAATNLQVQVELRDPDGTLAIHSSKAFAGELVTYATQSRTIAEHLAAGAVFTNVLITPPFTDHAPVKLQADGTTTPLPAEAAEVAREAAWSFHHLVPAKRYALDELGATLDHQLPVEMHLHQPTPAIEYNATVGAIMADTHAPKRTDLGTHGNSSHLSWSTPDGRERHEFGHHVYAASQIGGKGSFPPLTSPKDKNHGGVANSDSTDSLTEGFASYFATLVGGTSIYNSWGHPIDLEANRHVIPGTEIPSEEMEVAALLWDLQDGTDEPGDRIAIGPAGLWDLIDSRFVATVLNVYGHLEGEVGGERSEGPQGPTDLERVFIDHGFWHDEDGDGAWSPGEPVGWADSYDPERPGIQHPRATPRPSPPAPVAVFEITSELGAPVVAAGYDVTYEHADPYYDRTDRRQPIVLTQLPLHMDPGVQRVIIKPILVGSSTEPVVLERADYLSMAEQARAEGSGVLGIVEITATSKRLSPPAGLSVTATPQGPHLAWQLPQGVEQVVVVRGAQRAPATPLEGTVVHQGSGTEVTDHQALPGVENHYAFFSLGSESTYSSPATLSTAVAPPNAVGNGDQASGDQATGGGGGEAGQAGGEGGFPIKWVWIGLMGVAGGLVAAWLTRER